MQLEIDIPDELFDSINETQNSLSKLLKQKLAIELYKEDKISISQGANLLETDIYSFMKLLNEHKIPAIENYDIKAELKSL